MPTDCKSIWALLSAFTYNHYTQLHSVHISSEVQTDEKEQCASCQQQTMERSCHQKHKSALRFAGSPACVKQERNVDMHCICPGSRSHSISYAEPGRKQVLCCVLCAVCCVLCAVCCVLCVVCCVLCAVCCVLCVVCCVLCVVCCVLCVVCCVLCAVCCVLCVVCCVLCSVALGRCLRCCYNNTTAGGSDHHHTHLHIYTSTHLHIHTTSRPLSEPQTRYDVSASSVKTIECILPAQAAAAQ